MKIGYARVSTREQNLDMQVTALKAAGCEEIYQEKITSFSKDRPELASLVSKLRRGDVVVVWKLDRLARSVKELIGMVDHYREMGVDFISLKNNIDTTSPEGKFYFYLIAAMGELERDLIRQRTLAGLEEAKKRGNFPGRKAGLSEAAEKKAAYAYRLHTETGLTLEEKLEVLQLSQTTFYRYIRYVQGLADQKVKASGAEELPTLLTKMDD